MMFSEDHLARENENEIVVQEEKIHSEDEKILCNADIDG